MAAVLASAAVVSSGGGDGGWWRVVLVVADGSWWRWRGWRSLSGPGGCSGIGGCGGLVGGRGGPAAAGLAACDRNTSLLFVVSCSSPAAVLSTSQCMSNGNGIINRVPTSHNHQRYQYSSADLEAIGRCEAVL